MHTPSVATLGLDGRPRIRTVVLRDFDEGAGTLRFHTDRRSEKVSELARDPRIGVHFYDEAAKVPRGDVQMALAQVSKIYAKIHDAESDMNLEPMRAPDFGFCWASHKWASGHSLTSILKGSELTVGDFVRAMKQIIDLLRQLRAAAPDLQPIIDQSLKQIDRGVIAYAGAAL